MVQAIPFATPGLDRAGHLRRDEDWLAAALKDPHTRIMLLRSGEVLSRPDRMEPIWLGPQAMMLGKRKETLFLGLDEAGHAVFALDLPSRFNLEESPIAGLGAFADMRGLGATLSAQDANIAGTARAMFEWHHKHGFCAQCGAPSDPVEAGWKRICGDCETQHFPRTDPVAIMLAVRGDMCLLGRQAQFPAGFWSCLAGFVEPGETVEDAARRELFEEAGIRAGAARYLFAQPWPFPSSLMVGLILEAETTDITVDAFELEDARWFTRDEARAMLNRTHPTLFAPPPVAIAHHILKVWADESAR
jgi:NAD+ diphosphatase